MRVFQPFPFVGQREIPMFCCSFLPFSDVCCCTHLVFSFQEQKQRPYRPVLLDVFGKCGAASYLFTEEAAALSLHLKDQTFVVTSLLPFFRKE